MSEAIERKLKDIISRIEELEIRRDPNTLRGKIDLLFDNHERLQNQMIELLSKVKAIQVDEKYVELFTDEELQRMYKVSNIQLPDVVNFIKKEFGEEVSTVTASNYIQGNIKDLKKRSIIGKFLRRSMLMNNDKRPNN